MLKRIMIALSLFVLATLVLIGGVFAASRLYPEQELLAHTVGVGGGILWMFAMVTVIILLSDLRPSRV